MLQKTIKYSNPHQKVLKPAIDEINTKSDLWVSKPEIIGKKGKKITDIRLYFGNKNEKISDDFTKELIKQYNKFKSFTIFSGCYYLREGENLPLSEMVKITRIGADKSTGFFTAYYGDSFNQHTILTSPNKDDFLKELANGVYRTINAIYEKEKKEQLPTMQ